MVETLSSSHILQPIGNPFAAYIPMCRCGASASSNSGVLPLSNGSLTPDDSAVQPHWLVDPLNSLTNDPVIVAPTVPSPEDDHAVNGGTNILAVATAQQYRSATDAEQIDQPVGSISLAKTLNEEIPSEVSSHLPKLA